MRRRAFIGLLGATAAWPLVAHAQQPTMPVIGFVDARTSAAISERLRAYRQGLKETGFVEGENVTILYRYAEHQNERLSELVNDLIRRQVALIATAGDDVALAAKAATRTIPIVSIVSQDPVMLGLVGSLAKPGGNVTGVNFFSGELVAKRLAFLRELVPGAARIAVIVNPANVAITEPTLRDVETAARAARLQINVLNASTVQEIDAAFALLSRERPDALLITPDTFLSSRRVQLVNLATRHAIPAAFPTREYAESGGLMSYGSNIFDAWRQAGAYAGRILKGAQPADLPVVQAAKFELVINASTARMLGLTVPATLLATADEVIE